MVSSSKPTARKSTGGKAPTKKLGIKAPRKSPLTTGKVNTPPPPHPHCSETAAPPTRSIIAKAREIVELCSASESLIDKLKEENQMLRRELNDASDAKRAVEALVRVGAVTRFKLERENKDLMNAKEAAEALVKEGAAIRNKLEKANKELKNAKESAEVLAKVGVARTNLLRSANKELENAKKEAEARVKHLEMYMAVALLKCIRPWPQSDLERDLVNFKLVDDADLEKAKKKAESIVKDLELNARGCPRARGLLALVGY